MYEMSRCEKEYEIHNIENGTRFRVLEKSSLYEIFTEVDEHLNLIYKKLGSQHLRESGLVEIEKLYFMEISLLIETPIASLFFKESTNYKYKQEKNDEIFPYLRGIMKILHLRISPELNYLSNENGYHLKCISDEA